MPNNFYTEPQGLLAKRLAEVGFGGKSFFCNSGAESVEAAIKLARLSTPEGKYRIISLTDSFHGRTLGAIAATGQPKYHQGFAPLPAGFDYVPINDLDALTQAITEETCGILIEPIQGEGGINPASAEYLSAVRHLCDKKGLILIFDEVQCGVGRTGTMFGYQLSGVVPDIMTLAKGLGSGVPIGAICARPEIAANLKPGTHASTFGGNALACSAALAVLDTIARDDLLTHVKTSGDRIRKTLSTMPGAETAIKEVRGAGLMIGLEMCRPAADLVAACLESGLIINCTHDTVIRFMPALNVSHDDLNEAMTIFAKELNQWL